MATAEPLYRRTLETRERLLGPDHPDTLTSIDGLALLLHTQGDLIAAEALYRRAFETRERLVGPDHPDTLHNLNNLAVLPTPAGKHKRHHLGRRRRPATGVTCPGCFGPLEA